MPSIVAALLIFGGAGCTTGARVGSTAPRSDVNRDQALALARQVAASVGGRVYVIAPTGSMLPTLDESSIVAVERVPLNRLNKGDIIVYRTAAGTAVIHRLYEQHGARWFALGDNNASIDLETVSAENFLGRVCVIFYTSAKAAPGVRTALNPPLSALASRD